ncbi:(S)-benzoin forming benzil reductase [Bacillus subtilis]|nr:(S)-benzoin forming benzil reductase [Bacillus subtilis]TYS09133.1 (S)-benzoin forming benzil reductase [Bacillus subtilis]
MKHIIITGTSRGIGGALAQKLIDSNHRLYCISRQTNQNLIDQDTHMQYFSFDIKETHKIEALFQNLFAHIKRDPHPEGIYLINNAGMLSPVGPIEHNKAEDILQHMQVNLIAPMVMISQFVKRTKHIDTDKRIMNISSASAKYVLPSQSCYSTSKAGLDSFTKSIKLEQENQQNPVKIAAVYPGVIDTQLQTEIRSVRKEDFPYVDEFIQLKEAGKLQSPEDTADALIHFLTHDEFGEQAIVEHLFPIYE